MTSGSDSIGIPIKDDLDPAGWDLRKSLRLLAKSNGALIEWLHSPVIYRANEEFLEEMRCLAAENFSRRALANHYGAMARQVWKGALSKEGPSGKSYLYALRSFLCARHFTQVGTVPPVIFRELLPLVSGEVAAAIEELLGWKESATEAESPGRIAVLDDFLREGIEELGDEIAGLPAERHSAEPFNEALHRWTRWPVFPVRSLVQKVGFTLERVRQNDLLLFEGVSGSRSFGTEHAGSDTDLRGVFVAPLSFLVGLETIEQVSES